MRKAIAQLVLIPFLAQSTGAAAFLPAPHPAAAFHAPLAAVPRAAAKPAPAPAPPKAAAPSGASIFARAAAAGRSWLADAKACFDWLASPSRREPEAPAGVALRRATALFQPRPAEPERRADSTALLAAAAKLEAEPVPTERPVASAVPVARVEAPALEQTVEAWPAPRPAAVAAAQRRYMAPPALRPTASSFQLVEFDPRPRAGLRLVRAVNRVSSAPIMHRREIVSSRILSHDPSRPYGQRYTYEIKYADGGKEIITSSPLVFDLAGRGYKPSLRRTLFDIEGTGRDGHAVFVRDIAPWTGVLAFDADRDGKAGESGLELFGDGTDLDGDRKPDGHADGFAALKALVAKAVAEGVLGRGTGVTRRLDARALAALERAYGLSMKVGGLNAAPIPLADAGVVAITLSDAKVERQRDFDGEGNDVSRQEGAVFELSDGARREYVDVWFLNDAPKHAAPRRLARR